MRTRRGVARRLEDKDTLTAAGIALLGATALLGCSGETAGEGFGPYGVSVTQQALDFSHQLVTKVPVPRHTNPLYCTSARMTPYTGTMLTQASDYASHSYEKANHYCQEPRFSVAFVGDNGGVGFNMKLDLGDRSGYWSPKTGSQDIGILGAPNTGAASHAEAHAMNNLGHMTGNAYASENLGVNTGFVWKGAESYPIVQAEHFENPREWAPWEPSHPVLWNVTNPVGTPILVDPGHSTGHPHGVVPLEIVSASAPGTRGFIRLPAGPNLSSNLVNGEGEAHYTFKAHATSVNIYAEVNFPTAQANGFSYRVGKTHGTDWRSTDLTTGGATTSGFETRAVGSWTGLSVGETYTFMIRDLDPGAQIDTFIMLGGTFGRGLERVMPPNGAAQENCEIIPRMINDNGVVIGTYGCSSQPAEAWIRDANGTRVDFRGDPSRWQNVVSQDVPVAINNRADILFYDDSVGQQALRVSHVGSQGQRMSIPLPFKLGHNPSLFGLDWYQQSSAMNNTGHIVGYTDGAGGTATAKEEALVVYGGQLFLFPGTLASDFTTAGTCEPFCGSTFTKAVAVNDNGQIAGVARVTQGVNAGRYHVFLRTYVGAQRRVLDLGGYGDGAAEPAILALGAHGDVVGYADPSNFQDPKPFAASPVLALTLLPGWSKIFDVNRSGEVVGVRPNGLTLYTASFNASSGATTVGSDLVRWITPLCEAKGNDSSAEWISNLTLTSPADPAVSFAHDSNNDGGHLGVVDTTSETFGRDIQVNVGAGFAGSAYTEVWAFYLDVNRDGSFTADERIGAPFATGISGTTSRSLTFSQLSQSGRYKMRVAMRRWQTGADYTQGCASFARGEIQDYLVDIKLD